uniref:Nucleoside diphosphate kinase B n=1 Tax=Periophthalmus magnuspinnatus TaxID=409849 RepID=A0A3B4ACD0_9GOBI
MLATKGLTVVDVYQQWCGPCRAVISLLRKIKNELGDDLLHFAIAEADSIDALERYRGKCEPTFLFYAIKDEGLDEDKEEPKTQSEDEENIIVPASKSCTVSILKPDAVAHGKANEIIMKIQDAGFEILVHEERTLTEIEARDFYQHKAQEVLPGNKENTLRDKTAYSAHTKEAYSVKAAVCILTGLHDFGEKTSN